MSTPQHNSRPDASVIRAAELIQQGKASQAEPGLRRRLASVPGDAQANRLLAIVLLNTGKAAQAEYFAKRAAELAEDAAAMDALGTVYSVLNRLDDAVRAFSRGIELDARLPSLHNGLGGALLNARRYDDAAAAFGRARAIQPENPVYWRHEGAALARAGRTDEALALFASGIARFPDDVGLRMQRVGMLNYADEPRASVRQEHVELGTRLDRLGGTPPVFANAKDPGRVLRIGLLSADLFEHPVARFVAPLFTRGHPGLELFVYDASRKRDGVTARLKSLAKGWREVDAATDARIAETMRADRIDVAIDLGGHTLGSRIAALAHRCAPVQATYLGFPNTTGMISIGWRLVDGHTDPPGAEPWCTERLLRLDPCFLCFEDWMNEFACGAQSPRPDRPITFGSFNNPAKLSNTTLALWGRVLGAVPGSTLIIKGVGLELPEFRERLQGQASAAGLDPARVRCLPTTPGMAEHLAAYREIDVALDTYPYHGTTTTCEAMWMGVPVVTLAGETHVSRVGVSLLHAAGVPEHIADSPEAYVSIAKSLAGDTAARARLRTELPERLRRGPLGDGAGFVARFENAVRTAWRAWCGV